MTAAETGIYITLIAMMYERGEPIPNDTSRLARLCGTTTAALKSTLCILCDEGKISIVGDGLWNDRVGVETEIRRGKSTSAQKSAETRWKKQKQNQVRKDANAMLSQSARNANQIPEKIKEEPNGSSKKRGARLPDDFLPDMAGAIEAGLSEDEARREALKFRDYWISQPGQKGIKLDWPATWRNWCRHAVERRPQPRSTAPPSREPRNAGERALVRIQAERDENERAESLSGRLGQSDGRRQIEGSGIARQFAR